MSRSYQDFEPDCQYKKGEAHDIIEFQVKDFRKDQMKIHLGSNGVLTVSGERSLEGSKWIRFRKEFDTPKGCKAKDVRARFSSGFLYITIPNKITCHVPQQGPLTQVQQPESSSEPIQDKGKPKQENSVTAAPRPPTENADSHKARRNKNLSNCKMDKMTSMKIGASLITAAVLFVVLFYVFKFYAPHNYEWIEFTKIL